MRRTVLILAMMALCSGCSVFDMMLDAGYQSVKKWGKEALPILKSDLFEEVEKLADDTLDKAKAYAREKTEAAGKLLEAKVEARSGVPAPSIKEGEGVTEAIAEMKRWWADTQLENERRRLENERREREGEEPGPKPLAWYEMVLYSVLGGGGIVGAYAANSRREKNSIDRRVTGYLRNIGVLPNGPDTAPKKK